MASRLMFGNPPEDNFRAVAFLRSVRRQVDSALRTRLLHGSRVSLEVRRFGSRTVNRTDENKSALRTVAAIEGF